ncbi:MAG TPA: SOS response-associated peptidase [Steroidobacteraceae bacterium]|nr:SOS response-associated peptidase [Steroidobacteraceae bacterium]
MCGRFVTPEQAEAERNLWVAWPEYARSFNVAPSQRVPVVRWSGQARQGLLMRWGLVPYFAHGVPPRYSTINATLERLEDGPAWRGPWRRAQRCVLAAAGFYEWHVLPEGRKRPYYITCADQPAFGFAGLWDRSLAEDGRETLSCTLITLPANALLRDIHNGGATPFRMPAILAPADVEPWLVGSAAQARAALKPYASELMLAHPVSTRVNSPKNDDPSLTQPVAADALPT